ncbi:MAG: flagellar filament outer layer protein FlaA [Spirochaetaceae bacterium]|jgi:hypothetical protein|nr:flagellar filament outer layer protein FlaA [Spirochaetaceae bacterium]
MKRRFILVAMALMLVGAVAIAEEAVIIDFSLLTADIIADADGNMTQNGRTTMDFARVAGASFNEDQKALMKTSLAFADWEIVLNSSARNVTSVTLSQVKAAPVTGGSQPFVGQEVMGVRVLFPSTPVNSNARIVPAFEIPAFEPMATVDGEGNVQEPTDEEKASGKTRFEDGFGVVKNVGTIKSLKVTTMGMSFPHALYVLLKDTNSVERRYFMGYLNFDGWKELIWNNPDYISEIRNREVRIQPIYPNALPFVKFAGFQVVRDAAHQGGDFIGYFKDVAVIFDKALLTTERDIADEDLWGIVTKREREKQVYEMTRFGNNQVTRYLEKEKMAPELEFTSSLGEGDEEAPAAQQ